jgi:hypothetical protein
MDFNYLAKAIGENDSALPCWQNSKGVDGGLRQASSAESEVLYENQQR